MVLKFTSDEMRTILNALDFYSRIWIGQYDNILFDMRFYRDLSQLDINENIYQELLLKIRHILLPAIDRLGFNGSYGIFCDEVDSRAATAYNMQQVFRYALAYFLHPEGGITVDFNTPMPAENDIYKWPKAECSTENGTTYIEITIANGQKDIIKDALIINKAKFDGDMVKMFSYYTDSTLALDYAQQLTEMFNKLSNTMDNTENFSTIIEKLN